MIHFDDRNAPVRRNRGQDLPPRPADAPATPAEEWVRIPGFERYEVSNIGRVRSHPCVVMRGGYPARLPGRILKQCYDKNGYVHVSLNGRIKKVHRLVLLGFVGNPPKAKPVCCHYDGDVTNNHVGNLRWGSQLENKKDSRRLGETPRGEQCHLAKLKEADVIAIRSLDGTNKEISEKFSVTPSLISMIKSRKVWRHIQ